MCYGCDMPKTPTYWKEYRAKNRERLNEQRMCRYHRRKAIEEGYGDPDLEPMPESIPVPSVTTRRCMHAYCEAQGQPVQVQGMTAWLCVEHRPR